MQKFVRDIIYELVMVPFASSIIALHKELQYFISAC